MFKPKGPYDSDELIRPGCAWWSRLDGRWLVEVQYGLTGNSGNLCIFDNHQNLKLVHSQPTDIYFEARFGADQNDMILWQNTACDIIDNLEDA